MASQLCLVLGGVRSGKSAFAEARVTELSGVDGKPVLYVATGVAFDDEMKDRIQRHRESRPQEWSTLEEHVKIPEKLEPLLAADQNPGTVIIDSVDVWVGNLLMENQAKDRRTLENFVTSEADKLIALAKKSSQAFVFVSSEVGLSLVPPEALGRSFQDVLGTVNQRIAASATEVYLVIAGLATKIKPTGTE